MIQVFTIPFGGIINRLRGAGAFVFKNKSIDIPACKEISWILFGINTAILLGEPGKWFLINAVATTALYALWAIFGWGLYFAAFSGIWNLGDTHGVGWITRFCEKLIPVTDQQGTTPIGYFENKLRGLIAMSLRMGFIIPYFLYIGWRINDLILGLLCGIDIAIVCGFIYRDCQIIAAKFITVDNGQMVEWAEFFVGIMFMIMILYMKV